MGGFFAKLSVSALMFDFILTGPTSGARRSLPVPSSKKDLIDDVRPRARVSTRVRLIVRACTIVLRGTARQGPDMQDKTVRANDAS